MESETTISKLNSYKQLRDRNHLDDFINYLICKKILSETDYDSIYNHKVSLNIILGYVIWVSFCFRVERLNYLKYLKLSIPALKMF